MKRKKAEKGNALVRQYVLLGRVYLFGRKSVTFWREMNSFSKEFCTEISFLGKKKDNFSL